MKKLFLITIFIVSTFTLFSQDMNLPPLNGYKKVMDYPVFTPDNLWNFINGAADNYLAYGFMDLHVAEYKKGKDVIKLEVYHHKNNTMSFGIYSSERSPSFRFVSLGSQGYIADGAINFFKGDYYVKIRTYSKKEKVLQSAQTLAQQVANMLPGESMMPEVISQFPSEGKKVNDETYINESVLGHSFLNNAFKANYESGDQVFSVYIFDKSSAQDVLSTVNQYLKSVKMDETDEENGKVILNDGYNETIFLGWNGNRMVVISGLAKDQVDIAARYTSEILR